MDEVTARLGLLYAVDEGGSGRDSHTRLWARLLVSPASGLPCVLRGGGGPSRAPRPQGPLPEEQGLPSPPFRGAQALSTFSLLRGLAGRHGRRPGAPAVPGWEALAAVVALLVQVQLHADLGLHLQAGRLSRLLAVAPGQALVGPSGRDMVAHGVH